MKIIGVALIGEDGEVHFLLKPKRHHDVIHMLHDAEKSNGYIARCEQGFVLDNGVFVNRTEARKVVDANWQGIERDTHLKELFSEDVW